LGAVPLGALSVSGWSNRAEIPLRGSVALSRAALDEALVKAAVEAGVTVAAPARARPLGIDSDSRIVRLDMDGKSLTVKARVVIAADGLGSSFLSKGSDGEAKAAVPHDARIGLGAVFGDGADDYGPGVIHMAVGSAGYVGLVRLVDDTVNVASALDPGHLRQGERPETLVNEILAGAGLTPLPDRPIAGWSGTPVLTRTLATRGAERLFAVGDAAGYVEPFTGEGITWALSGARTLAPIAAEGIRSWEPDLVAAWDQAYHDTIGRAAAVCRGIAWGLRRPGLSRAGLRLLSLAPSLASPFVRGVSRAPAAVSGGAA